VLGVLLAAGLAACAGPPGEASPAAPEDTSRAEGAARRFLDTYVDRDGRVVRRDEGGDTVSEGQAYGLLMAAAVGDEPRFEAIRRWTNENLRRPDGLLSFIWRDGRVEDPQAASDADLDAAHALLLGSCRFERPELREEALALGGRILALETASVGGGSPVLAAGPWARETPATVNPSYFSPAAMAALEEASGDGRYGALSASSREVVGQLLRDPARLPPDWATFGASGARAVGGPDKEGSQTPRFSFDAPRTLVRLAVDPDPAGARIAARSWPVFARREPSEIVVEHDLSGRPVGETRHPVALVAAAGAARAAGKQRDTRRLLDAAEALDRRAPTYYGAAWVALGRLWLTSDALDACSS